MRAATGSRSSTPWRAHSEPLLARTRSSTSSGSTTPRCPATCVTRRSRSTSARDSGCSRVASGSLLRLLLLRQFLLIAAEPLSADELTHDVGRRQPIFVGDDLQHAPFVVGDPNLEDTFALQRRHVGSVITETVRASRS